MPIWSAEIKELEKLYDSIKGQLPELEKELIQLIQTEDPNVIMLYSRRSLEVIITDLCECELKRLRGTEPLKGIIDKLNKEKKVPAHIITSMHGLNDLSTYGTHPKDFDPEQVKPVLNNLSTIIKWYFKYKEPRTDVKAKPAEEIGQGIKSTENVKKDITISRKRLAGILGGSIGIIASVFAVLYFSSIIDSGKKTEQLDKSIAVLPFRNDSPDSTNKYFIDGTMEAILDNLCKIADLTVISRTSVEQFRSTTKPIREIAKLLNVNYILEGSGQKYGNDIRLTVQLIDAVNDKHIWSSPYEGVADNIFKLQSQIAQAIAIKLEAILTPEEKQIIENIPTSNMTAWDLYLRAKEYEKEYWKTLDSISYHKAANLYKTIIEIDPAFAKAYTGLARANYDRYYVNTYFKENFLDSCLILAKKALSLDNNLDEAYFMISRYYYANGHMDETLDNIDKTLRVNPNFYSAFALKGLILTSFQHDYIKGINNYNKALTLIQGEERPSLLRRLGNTYRDVGFFEKAKFYHQEALDLDDNKLYNYYNLAWIEICNENFEGAYKLVKEKKKIDSANYVEGLIPIYNLISGHDKEAYLFANKLIEYYKKSGILNIAESHRIGYAFWQVGKFKEAESYFDQQIKYDEESIKLTRNIAQTRVAQYDLAATYAFLGNKVKAYQYLDEFNKSDFYTLYRVILLKHDPLFVNIRNEERFQKILQNIEAKYQAEHERVKKWLEEQGML
jgi:TolB-like protein/Tfp pilus assembly protein PilF